MQEYAIQINGIEHTIQLDDDEAKRRGLTPATKAKAASNKATSAKNKSA